jgi:ankyrin repeat protein
LPYFFILILSAAQVGNVEIIEILLSHGANINDTQNAYGDTPSHIAVRFGNAEALRTLVAHGADLHITNSDEESVLEAARNGESEECLDVLNKA